MGMRAPALLPVFRSVLQPPRLLRVLTDDEARGATITDLARVLVVGVPNREAVYDAPWEKSEHASRS